MFLVRPDATLYYAAIKSMPFGRPRFDELAGAVDFVTKNEYPPRSES